MVCGSRLRQLVYNSTDGRSHNLEGVVTWVPGWGSLDSINYFDSSWSAYFMGDAAAYMIPLTKALSAVGYTAGKDIRGAPYDFRYLPQSQNYFPRLRKLIEDTYKANNRRKVALVSHSLGCRYTLLFLHQQSQKWKDTYIHSFFTLGAPWAGSYVAALAFISGYDFHVSSILPKHVIDEQRSSESNLFLFPTSEAVGKDDVLATKGNKSYKVDNLEDLFEDMGYAIGTERWKRMRELMNNVSHPGVKVHCLYSDGVDTERRMIYKYDDDSFTDPEIEWGDGDGVIHIESLRVCERWDPRLTSVKRFHNLQHTAGLMGDSGVHDYILKHIQ